EARASMGASMAQDNDEHGIEVDEEEFDVDAEGRVVAEDTGPMFGRRRTHNDELGVGPCGMIFGRGTCYGSESLPSIVHFIKQLYRNIRPPEHIIYDNNCSLAKYVKDNPFFANIGLSVDVFHFNCKHSAIDIFCQQNCNPCAFPELIDENGGWFFNTSVAEQTNAWLNSKPMDISQVIGNFVVLLYRQINEIIHEFGIANWYRYGYMGEDPEELSVARDMTSEGSTDGALRRILCGGVVAVRGSGDVDDKQIGASALSPASTERVEARCRGKTTGSKE
ncbi:hypothetical protein BDY19DRAFT_910995, partial [Irpex rosettiformis]